MSEVEDELSETKTFRIDAIRTLYEITGSIQRSALALGISERTFRKLLDECGVPVNNRGQQEFKVEP